MNKPAKIIVSLLLTITIFSTGTVLAQSDEIYQAIYNRDIEKVKELLKEKPHLINSKDSGGRTLLHEAARKGSWEILQFLISSGADIKSKDNEGKTPLHESARGGSQESVVLLISAGSDINARDHEGDTPLHKAAMAGDLEVINYLISKGSNVNAKNQEGYTPLIWPVWEGRMEVVNLLISKGADVNTKTTYSVTPLHAVVTFNILPVIEDKKIRIAELLLSEGANINAKDIDGETPFHWLSWNGSYKLLAHMLITEGADINAKNNFGATPLNLAIWNKKKKFVEFLKSMGAKENTHINKILTYRELNLQLAACGRNLSNIATAIELYCNDNKGLYPPTLEYLTGLDKSYLEVIPVCPACEKKLYIYEKSDNPANFTLQCGETNIHFKTGKVDEGNYPRYSPSEGLKFKN